MNTIRSSFFLDLFLNLKTGIRKTNGGKPKFGPSRILFTFIHIIYIHAKHNSLTSISIRNDILNVHESSQGVPLMRLYKHVFNQVLQEVLAN